MDDYFWIRDDDDLVDTYFENKSVILGGGVQIKEEEQIEKLDYNDYNTITNDLYNEMKEYIDDKCLDLCEKMTLYHFHNFMMRYKKKEN